MATLRKKSEDVRQFVLENIETDASGVVALTVKKFGISRQAVHKHIRYLIEQRALIRKKNGHYELGPKEEWGTSIAVNPNLSEDVIWRQEIMPHLGILPDNAISIWQYGFTEMFNNVIDHSEGKNASVSIKKTAHSIEMNILDNGVGIFTKIKRAMGLLDERHAVLELTKGKLTTDPTRHSGEGVFFTSRMFDSFVIYSGEVCLTHTYGNDEDWIMETSSYEEGTFITMRLKNNTAQTTKHVFDKFTSDDQYGFTKTIIPVRLAQYGNEKLVSRSQAKRLLERVDRFKVVILDFKEVDSIGQAFADEVFRVFTKQHPEIQIVPLNENSDVKKLIGRIKFEADTEAVSLDLPLD